MTSVFHDSKRSKRDVTQSRSPFSPPVAGDRRWGDTSAAARFILLTFFYAEHWSV